MTHESIPSESANADRRRRLDVVRLKMRSQSPSDIFGAMLEVRKVLQENSEDQAVYETLLDAVRDNPRLRQEVRGLLEELIQRGSKSAAAALRVLPADIKDLMADADDAYYTADYDQAIELYRQVLEKDSANVRAREQLAKAELNRIAGMPDTELPRAAIQLFRRARSHIAARDFVAATNLLNAALEEARARGKEFPEAEKLINSIQDLWTAEEYKAKADLALKNEQWGSAWDLYNKAVLLNPHDPVTKELIDGLDNLMRADALLDSISDQQVSEKERREKLEKIDVLLKTVEEIKMLVGTSLLKNSRVRYNKLQEKGLRTVIYSRRAQIIIVALLLVVLAGVYFLVFNINRAVQNQPILTQTLSEAIPVVLTLSPVATNSPMSSPTASPSPQATLTPTITPTETVTPVPTLAGFEGFINRLSVTVRDSPNGKFVEKLENSISLAVLITDQQSDTGGNLWYKCRWTVGDVVHEGWILADYIELGEQP